jgi:uncharacterized protein YyaL (SSP411 family)
MRKNRLINEKSAYLRQHSHNPVDWYPWGAEAFNLAKKMDKPIFLSIGYSTCHWCHVMERESFNDPEVASLLNDVFVCIKVDREERPDVDAFYMKVCQMMTGSGGWPLTIIMTPDGKPFFAGTYFPKESRYNRIGLLDLAKNVKNVWNKRRSDVESAAQNLIGFLKSQDSQHGIEDLDESYINDAYQSLKFAYDGIYGGFGSAPKFPTPQNILFLLDFFALNNEPTALEMVEKTLLNMRLGGIFDQIGFGFHRYSTDAKWLVPHFEKMLYDQAMLLLAYSRVYKLTQKDFYLNVANEMVEYVTRELLSNGEAFFSSEDADSEGVEGKFYLFEYKELENLLGTEFELFSKVFNIKPSGNFEDLFGENVKKNILHLSGPMEEIARELNIDISSLKNKIEYSRRIVFEYREKRVKPFKDRKIMTDWNGLMIAGLANYYSITQRKDVLDIINNYLEFFVKNIYMHDGSLAHLYYDGESKIDGFLDDYAFSAFGFLEAFENTFDHKFLSIVDSLLTKAIELFWDENEMAFYFTAKDKCETALNTIEFFDGAIPSGNSVMYYCLNRFHLITGNKLYFNIARKLEKTIAKHAKPNPLSHNFFNFALQKQFGHSLEVVIVYKDENDENFKKPREFLTRNYIPNSLIVFFNPLVDKLNNLVFWEKYKILEDKTTMYLCSNFTCSEPITNFDVFVNEIKRKLNGG